MNTFSSSQSLRELTLRGMILGAIITVLFTASNVYLGLKVGMTFASSIPAAVISMAVLKMFSGANILENNMVQTQASSAGTLSSIFMIIPGLLMLGYWNHFPFLQTVAICAAGGILGVLFTIPLRRVMVVQSDLPYPEGVAAAEILKAGNHKDGSESGIKDIAIGGLFSGIVAFLTNGLRVIADSTGFWFKSGNAVFQLPMGFSLALLGAGYLVGIVGGIAILVGVILTWGIAIPYFSADSVMPADMSLAAYAMGIWKAKARLIAVGIMGVASVWTLLTLVKPMVTGMKQSFRLLKSDGTTTINRTDQDLSPKTMLLILLAAVVVIAFALHEFILAAPISAELSILLVVVCTLLAVVVGFFIAAAAGYMAGLVGSSASPISGISIISVVLTSLVLALIGNLSGIVETEEGQQFLTALTLFSCSIVVCVASISNDNLQDLKTGYLVEATPWRQQVALIIGCIVGALVIAPVLEILYNAYGFTGALPRPNMSPDQALSAPQATLITTVAQGIFTNKLDWTYISTGAGLGVVLIVIDSLLKKTSNKVFALPPLAVGIGIYLPPATTMPVIVGAFLAWFLNRQINRYAQKTGNENVKKTSERYGTLFAAGLIVGESLIGVVIAFIIAISVTSGGSDAPLAINLENWQVSSELIGLGLFIACILLFIKRVFRAKN